MDYEQISCRSEDGTFIITLNRPEKLNAFTLRMRDELLHALDTADADDSVRAIVVTGAGRAFCAGADLGEGGKTFDYRHRLNEQEAESHRDGGGVLSLRIFELRKPIIAAINGAAVGVGITMTLPMDIRLAGDEARIGFVFARRGIVPEACSSWFLPRIVGISQALEWIYSGRVFTAQEAFEKGLVSRVVVTENLLTTAKHLARDLADQTSALSVALSRRMLWQMLGAQHPMDAHRVESRAIYYMGSSADAKEGVESFLQKRPARFGMSASRDFPDIPGL